MAADGAAVLAAADVERAHVFGVSMGGMIAQEFALQYPSRVRSLVLTCTSCGAPHAVPARPEVLAALDAQVAMTREQAMWMMAPFMYDAATPRERIDEDLASRLSAPVTNSHIVMTDRFDASMDAMLSFLEECAHVDEQAVS
jgi:3-oxoadipate enol-lactonase